MRGTLLTVYQYRLKSYPPVCGSNLQCPTGPCALRTDCTDSARSPCALRMDCVESVCTPHGLCRVRVHSARIVWSPSQSVGLRTECVESEPVRADSAQKLHSARIEPGFQHRTQ